MFSGISDEQLFSDPAQLRAGINSLAVQMAQAIQTVRRQDAANYATKLAAVEARFTRVNSGITDEQEKSLINQYPELKDMPDTARINMMKRLSETQPSTTTRGVKQATYVEPSGGGPGSDPTVDTARTEAIKRLDNPANYADANAMKKDLALAGINIDTDEESVARRLFGKV